MAVIVVINRPELDKYLHSPTGQVGKYLSKRGSAVVAAARLQVGKQTGFLAGSIHMRQTRESYGQKLMIGSSLNYALAHHEGTKPHLIVPNRAKALRFHSGGRIIYTRMVKHPGTRPNRYLKDNLYLVFS